MGQRCPPAPGAPSSACTSPALAPSKSSPALGGLGVESGEASEPTLRPPLREGPPAPLQPPSPGVGSRGSPGREARGQGGIPGARRVGPAERGGVSLSLSLAHDLIIQVRFSAQGSERLRAVSGGRQQPRGGILGWGGGSARGLQPQDSSGCPWRAPGTYLSPALPSPPARPPTHVQPGQGTNWPRWFEPHKPPPSSGLRR